MYVCVCVCESMPPSSKKPVSTSIPKGRLAIAADKTGLIFYNLLFFRI